MRGFGFYGIDMYYIILVLPAILFTMFAQMRVKSTFNKFSGVNNMRGLTGAQIARAMLQANGLTSVRIERCEGSLTDHYDPKANTVRLSQTVHDSTSVAAAGIAAHECGHAIQYAVGYAPIKLRMAIIPVSRIGSSLAIPLILLGAVFSFQPLISLGIIFFGAAVLFQLVTLPVEFNASRRAVAALEESGSLSYDELPQTKKVLSAAAMTYVAALAVSLAQFLRLILIFGGRRRD